MKLKVTFAILMVIALLFAADLVDASKNRQNFVVYHNFKKKKGGNTQKTRGPVISNLVFIATHAKP